MLKRMADNRNRQSLSVHFRKRRFAFFQSLLSQLNRPIHILDIGGTEAYWRTMGLGDDRVFITLLNLSAEEVTAPHMTSIAGDARCIQLDDQCFDIVFSNSVIEHVGGYPDQLQMAKEICRVGKRYFVQTPNRYFPIEPHFLFPFFQFLPVNIRMKLLQNFNLGWFPRTPDEQKARAIIEDIHLLNRDQFVALFPGARLYEEKVLGITKSLIVYGGWGEKRL